MFQTIMSFINLIPPVFELAYVQYIKQKSRYIISKHDISIYMLEYILSKRVFKKILYICHIYLTSEMKVMKR